MIPFVVVMLTDFLLCEIQADAVETVDDLKVTTETGCSQ